MKNKGNRAGGKAFEEKHKIVCRKEESAKKTVHEQINQVIYKMRDSKLAKWY